MKILEKLKKPFASVAAVLLVLQFLFIGAPVAAAVSYDFLANPYSVQLSYPGGGDRIRVKVPNGTTAVNFFIDVPTNVVSGFLQGDLATYDRWEMNPYTFGAGQHTIGAVYTSDGSTWVPADNTTITYALDKPWFNYLSPDPSNFTFRPGDNPVRVAIDDEFNQFKKVTFQLYNYNIGAMARGTNVGAFDVFRANCDLRESGSRVLCDINDSASWSNLPSGYYMTDLTSSDLASGGIRVADPGTDSHYFYVDATPPTLTDFTVDNYSTVMSKTAILSANAADFSGIDNVEFYLTAPRISDSMCDGNGTKLVTQKSIAPDTDGKYRVTLDTSAYNGNYCVNAISEDNAAAHSTISKSAVLLDNTVPLGGPLTIVTNLFPAGLTVAAPIDNVYTLQDLSIDGTDVFNSLKVVVTDTNLDTANVPVFVDGAENGYMSYDGSAWNYAGQTSVPDFSTGTHNLVATFSDLAKNTTTLTARFTTDNLSPAGGSLTMKTVMHPEGITVSAPTDGLYLIHPALSIDGLDVFDSLKVEVTDLNLNTDAVPVYVDGTENGEMVYDGVQWNYRNQSSVPIFNTGDHNLVTTFRDNAGNTTTLTARFTTDNTAPALSGSPTPAGLSSIKNQNLYVVFTDAQGFDTVKLNNLVSYKVDGVIQTVPGTCITLSGVDNTTFTFYCTIGAVEDGTHTLDFQVRDMAGNVSSNLHWTYEVDTTSPTKPTLAFPADNTFVNGNLLVNDWNPSPEADTHHYIYQSYNNAAATSIRWTGTYNAPTTQKMAVNVANTTFWWRVKAVDNLGNTSDWSDLWKVTVNNNAPVISEHEKITVEATSPDGAVVTYELPTAIDVVDVTVPVICLPASGSVFALGITNVNCSSTDTGGHTSTSLFQIAVVDTTAPIITLPEDITVEADVLGGKVVTYVASGTDMVDETTIVTCLPLSESLFPVGVTKVTCNSTDANLNTSEGSFNITVNDKSSPIIALTGITADITVGGVYTELGAIATDIVDGVFAATQSGNVNTAVAGSYVITYSATDIAGNIATPVTRTVNVLAAPVVLAPALAPPVPAPTAEETPEVLGATTAEPKTAALFNNRPEVKGSIDDSNENNGSWNKFFGYKILGVQTWSWLLVLGLILGGWWFLAFGRKRQSK